MRKPFFFDENAVEVVNSIMKDKDYDSLYFSFEYIFDMFFLRCHSKEEYEYAVKTIEGALRSSKIAWEEGNL